MRNIPEGAPARDRRELADLIEALKRARTLVGFRDTLAEIERDDAYVAIGKTIDLLSELRREAR